MKKEYTAQDHSFAICAYKESSFLEEAILSVQSQRAFGTAFVVTSTPNEHIESICKRCGIPYASSGLQSSITGDWNFAYDVAETELVTIVHQDDIYDPNYLEAVLEKFNSSSKELALVHTDYYEIRNGRRVDSNQILKIKRSMNKCFASGLSGSSSAIKQRWLSFGNAICCPSVTLNKRICGPSVFDTRYANSCDWRTWLNLAERNLRFGYVPQSLMGHRIYAGSTTTKNIESSVRSKEDLEIFKSLWPEFVAKGLFSVYSKSENSNDVAGD